MPEAVIVDCLRTAVGKAGRSALRNIRPDDLAGLKWRSSRKCLPALPTF